MKRHPTPLQVITTRATEGGPKEHWDKQKWQRETHSVTYAQGLSTLSYLSRCRAASTVIPLSPKTFTPSILPNLGLKASGRQKPRAGILLEVDLSVRPESYYYYLVPDLRLLPPSTSFWPYGAHSFFPHAQTISILNKLIN